MIATWNLAIAWDFVDRGRTQGEPIGSTGRYIASHPKQQVYLIADEQGPYPYFTWGYPYWWSSWLARFTSETKAPPVVPSDQLNMLNPQPPFALLMSRQLLYAAEADLASRYPQGRVRNILPAGRLVVFEVRGESTIRG